MRLGNRRAFFRPQTKKVPRQRGSGNLQVAVSRRESGIGIIRVAERIRKRKRGGFRARAVVGCLGPSPMSAQKAMGRVRDSRPKQLSKQASRCSDGESEGRLRMRVVITVAGDNPISVLGLDAQSAHRCRGREVKADGVPTASPRCEAAAFTSN